jgi:hypothetical protein
MSDARRAAAVLLLGSALALVAALAVAAGDQRQLAFANGVGVLGPVATLQGGQRACQLQVPAVAAFASVRLAADTAGRPGPRLAAEVRDSASDRRLGQGTVPAGYVAALDTPAGYPSTNVGAVRGDEREMDVCIANRGRTAVALGGDGKAEVGDSRLVVDGQRRPGGLTLAFGRQQPTTLLAQLPVALERASLFHPPLLGRWTLWLLGALVAFAVPVALAFAVAGAVRAEREPAPRTLDRP